jgi:hypothetical protein
MLSTLFLPLPEVFSTSRTLVLPHGASHYLLYRPAPSLLFPNALTCSLRLRFHPVKIQKKKKIEKDLKKEKKRKKETNITMQSNQKNKIKNRKIKINLAAFERLKSLGGIFVSLPCMLECHQLPSSILPQSCIFILLLA